MTDVWIEVSVDADAASRVVLVLDASRGSDRYREQTVRLAVDLLDSLPRASRPWIYFLGNPQPYTAARASQNLADWYRANNGRARVIGEILEQFDTGYPLNMVVLASGRIFDLEDWLDTPILSRATFVRLGEVSITNGLCKEWKPSAEIIKPHLDNPIVCLSLSGSTMMPIYWDNNAYSWDGAQLVAKEASASSLRANVLCQSIGSINAVASLADGNQVNLHIVKCEPVAQAEWQPVTEKESKLLRECLATGKYQCPICAREHTSDQFYCKGDKKHYTGGDPVYSSLKGLSGFVLLQDSDQGSKARCHPCPVLRISEDAVAVRMGGRAEVHRFDEAKMEWRNTQVSMGAYCPVGDGSYAIML